MIPLGLYLHLPWCVSRCPYCDFNAHAAAAFDEARYAGALLQELERAAAHGRALSSVFFGGGTPSRFGAASIRQLLARVRADFDCAAGLEVTLEANPESADRARFAGYREAGVNRLSIGVQSFDAASLRALGRAHDPDGARAAIRAAREAGFGRLNLDLMYGLPGQSPAMARRDLAEALKHGPEHLSWYQLTLEPGTPFARRPPALPGHEAVWEMHRSGAELLAAAGYDQYEVSAWCRDGAVCRHNVNYWEYGDYLGLGAGAHGKWTAPDGTVWRAAQPRDPGAWMRAAEAGNASGEREFRGAADRMFEFMLGALRLRRGFAWPLFEERAGQSRGAAEAALAAAEEQGLIEMSATGLRASDRGWRYLDDLCGLFLPDNSSGAGEASKLIRPARNCLRPAMAADGVELSAGWQGWRHIFRTLRRKRMLPRSVQR